MVRGEGGQFIITRGGVTNSVSPIGKYPCLHGMVLAGLDLKFLGKILSNGDIVKDECPP